jgi:hypothetical protein
MPKEDYLLRYLEKLSRVIAAMLGLRIKGLPDESLHLADETYKDMLDLNVAEIGVLSAEVFQEIIRKHAYTNSYLEIITELTHETAHSFREKGEEENAKRFYGKALQLYYLLNEKDKTFSFEREQIIAELEELTNTH